MEKLRTLSV